MSLLGKDEEKPTIIPPQERKEVLVSKLLTEATEKDDSTLVNFVLCHCWNKDQIFIATSKDGIGLLHHAVRNNFPNTVRVLIEHGVNVNYRNKEGNTSLHVSAQLGFEMIVNLLIESGCNPFIENSVGKQAIDCVDKKDHVIKENLRKYAVKCSRVKVMKNLETWKNIVAEEERTAEEMKKKSKLRVPKARRKTSVIQVPTLKRTDSGIISDFDSDKSPSYSSLASTSPSNSKQQITEEKENDKKLGKSKSFSVKDITHQYNNVTNALRKLSSNANKNSNDGNNSKDTVQRKTSKTEIRKHSSGGGMIVSALYGGADQKKTSKRRKKIDRTQRMSLPLLPIFAPPESYI